MAAPIELPVRLGTNWCRADKATLVVAIRERDMQIRRLQAEQGEILAEMQSRGVPQTYGYANLEALLKDAVSCTRSDGRKRVRRALACNDYAEGAHRVPASAPETAVAFGEGAINTAHVDSILDTLAEVPGTVPEQERNGYERILVNLARKSHPASVTKAEHRLLAWLEQDHLKSDRPLRVRQSVNSTGPGTGTGSSVSPAAWTRSRVRSSRNCCHRWPNHAPDQTVNATPAPSTNATAMPSPNYSTTRSARPIFPPKLGKHRHSRSP